MKPVKTDKDSAKVSDSEDNQHKEKAEAAAA